jgi:hypothetical protein
MASSASERQQRFLAEQGSQLISSWVEKDLDEISDEESSDNDSVFSHLIITTLVASIEWALPIAVTGSITSSATVSRSSRVNM